MVSLPANVEPSHLLYSGRLARGDAMNAGHWTDLPSRAAGRSGLLPARPEVHDDTTVVQDGKEQWARHA